MQQGFIDIFYGAVLISSVFYGLVMWSDLLTFYLCFAIAKLTFIVPASHVIVRNKTLKYHYAHV